MKRNSVIREALRFDDVLLVPAESNVKASEVSVQTRLTRSISLNMPLVSAGRADVTESAMAIAMAQLGGLGVIHDDMPMGKQVEEVRRVKRAEGDMVSNPITIAPDASVAEALDLMTTYKISGLPVIEQPSQRVAGIITRRDIRFFEDYAKPVSTLMTKEVVTVQGKIEKEMAKNLFHQHRIEKLVVVDGQGRCVGLVTVRDIERLSRYPHASRDAQGRLRVGAAVGLGKDAFDRAAAMADAGLDAVFVDTEHAHSREAIGTVSRIRQQRSNDVQVIAGNVVTADAARSLIDAGADAIKVGVRTVSGVGMPQMAAILAVAELCALQNIPVILDGGARNAATLAKALAAGAESAMIGYLFSGTDEAPGKVVYQDLQPCKVVNNSSQPSRGSVAGLAHELTEGLKAAMAHVGCRDLSSLRENAEFVRVG